MNSTPSARRVLVVDDNVDSAESLTMLLTVMGSEARAAHTGEEAIRVVREFGPHAVFLDIGMPGMDGLEVAQRLRAEHTGLFLIAVTGYGEDEDRRQSKAAGFDEHLVKPIDPTALRSLLASLGGRGPAS